MPPFASPTSRLLTLRFLSPFRWMYLAAALLPALAYGQTSNTIGSIGNSPLSQLGIGEMLPQGGAREQSFGEAGSAAPSGENISLLNPAGLYYQRQLNLESTLRTGFKRGMSADGVVESGRFTPLSLNMVLPIARPVTLAIGLRQHAALDYTVQATGSTLGDGSTYTNFYSGAGSIAQGYLAAGVRLADGLTVGAQGTYWFGTQRRYSDLSVAGNAVTRELSSRVSDVQMRFGAIYRRSIRGRRLGLSIAAELPRTLRTSDEIVLRSYTASTLTSVDTLQRETPGTLVAPRSIRIGLAYERPQRYSFVADVAREYWRGTQPLGTTTQLLDSYRAGAGVEWIPNYNGQRYPQFVSYRAGIFARQLPYDLAGVRMTDLGLTLGLGLPVLRKEARYTRPIVNLNVTAGRRSGPTGSGSYRENYINFTLGLILNDSQWFVRYKID